MTQFLLHVGYPKAGSSSLQKIFHLSPRFDLAICRYESKSIEEVEFLRYLTLADGIEYDSGKAANMLGDVLNKETDASENSIRVLSEEIFTSASGAYADRSLMANRLKTLFPDGKVMIIIRNQVSLIRSRYEHCPYDILCLCNGLMKPRRFSDWIEDNFKRKYGTYISSYHFSEMVKEYIGLFGEENVFVGLFEEMVSEPFIFWQKVEKFLNRPGLASELSALSQKTHENISRGLGAHKFEYILRENFLVKILIKIVPKFIRKSIFKILFESILKIISAKASHLVIPDKYIETFNTLYAPGNTWLAKQYKLDLKRYNYPLL